MNSTALVLIDIQKGLDEWDFYGGNRNNLKAEKNASKLLEVFRKKKLPIYHVKHSSTNTASPLHASKPGFKIKDEVQPRDSEPVFVKKVNSAFIGTNLEKVLKEKNISKLVIAGLTTNHCISTSVRMAANLGFEVTLAANACATFDFVGIKGQKFDAELMHQTALASLKNEFAEIQITEKIMFNIISQ
jgi:nicotinamidase-related amidase